MDFENALTVGEILKPQGIRGELKVKPFTDSEEDFKKFSRIYIGGQEYRILSVRTGGGAVYLGLKGVPDRNAAELLRGKEILLLREDAPEPEAGRYYIVDLLGCEIVGDEGAHLGVLKEIYQRATDVYVLDKDGEEILFPALKDVIVNVEIGEKRITVNEKRFHEVAVK